jgi:hypothetical protein
LQAKIESIVITRTDEFPLEFIACLEAIVLFEPFRIKNAGFANRLLRSSMAGRAEQLQ